MSDAGTIKCFSDSSCTPANLNGYSTTTPANCPSTSVAYQSLIKVNGMWQWTACAARLLDEESQLVDHEEDFAAEAELDAAELDAAADLAHMVEAEFLAADA